MVGTKQGEYIRDQLDLDNAAGPFNIELVTGDPGDNNARFFFGGAMTSAASTQARRLRTLERE